MARVLTSWKEIAQYVGKGVRTVQRWEREVGFPVNRPNGGSVIVAFTNEIDTWLHGRRAYRSELERLRGRVAELEAECEKRRLKPAHPDFAGVLEYYHSIRIEAARTRLRAIQAQLSLAFSACGMAESLLDRGYVDQAQNLILKLEHLASTIRTHLSEPNHIPPGEAGEPLNQLERLESSILRVWTRAGRVGAA